MDSSTEDKYLKAWRFKSKKSLEDHVASKMHNRNIEAIALLILGKFRLKVEEWEKEQYRPLDCREKYQNGKE